MRVGIVGGGVCGLAAARTLQAAGHTAVVFEKNKRVGGRMRTIRMDGFTWDTGATSIAPRGKLIEPVILHELDTSDLVKIELPIYLHEGLRVSPGIARGADRYVYRSGMDQLAKLLAANLDVRLGVEIERIEESQGGYRIAEEAFDELILTPPAPRTAALLWTVGQRRPIDSIVYRRCLSVALGYSEHAPAASYFALFDPERRHPMNWLSLESVKCDGRAPKGGSAFCVQFGPAFSEESFSLPEQELVQTAAFYLSRLYGEAFTHPSAFSVKRWMFSQPDAVSEIEIANPRDSRILIGGDALLGGRLEEAFEVGVRIADRLLEGHSHETVR